MADLCQRCGKLTVPTVMSMFNTQDLCLACSEEEKKHPRYPEAVAAERTAVASGNLNYSGIGWTPLPELCLCGDLRPCPHLDPVRCDVPGCEHFEEDHEAYGRCLVAGCICRQFLSHALFDFKLVHGGRTFDEWCDGRNLDGLQELIYAARDAVNAWKSAADIRAEMGALAISLRPFRAAPPPEDYAPKCVRCVQSREHTEMMAVIAGISDPICCSDGSAEEREQQDEQD